jgi:hypothetical protein
VSGSGVRSRDGRLTRLSSVKLTEVVGSRVLELTFYVYEGVDEGEAVEEVLSKAASIRMHYYLKKTANNPAPVGLCSPTSAGVDTSGEGARRGGVE